MIQSTSSSQNGNTYIGNLCIKRAPPRSSPNCKDNRSSMIILQRSTGVKRLALLKISHNRSVFILPPKSSLCMRKHFLDRGDGNERKTAIYNKEQKNEIEYRRIHLQHRRNNDKFLSTRKESKNSHDFHTNTTRLFLLHSLSSLTAMMTRTTVTATSTTTSWTETTPRTRVGTFMSGMRMVVMTRACFSALLLVKHRFKHSLHIYNHAYTQSSQSLVPSIWAPSK